MNSSTSLQSLARASASAHCTSRSPMPRLRQWAATRTSSISAREDPCELNPGRMQSCRLQAADHRAVTVLCDHELDIRIAVERVERPEIGWRQRILDPLARAAERIVRQHRHDDADVVAAGAPEGDGGRCGHDGRCPARRAGGNPSDRSASAIQRCKDA